MLTLPKRMSIVVGESELRYRLRYILYISF